MARPGWAGRYLVLLLLVLSSALFVGLGLWQLERRTQKLKLIDAVDHRVGEPAADAPGPASWSFVSFDNDAYRHVRIGGTFAGGRDTLVQAATGFGPGFWMMSPLRTDAGWTVLVNRGFVSADDPRPTAPQGHVVVAGLLRISEPGGGFLHSNDPSSDRWYSRDVAAIAATRGLQGVAPYFIDADAASTASLAAGSGVAPVGGLTVISFHNSHLVYALTWYGLALMMAGACYWVVRDERRRSRAGRSGQEGGDGGED